MNVNDFIYDFEEAYRGDPWLGISILKSLNAISWQDANKRPDNARKTIAEMLLHIINWRVFVIAKLKNHETFDIALNSEEDWSTITLSQEADWALLLVKLEETQDVICTLIQGKSEHWLGEITAGKTSSNAYMLRGIIQHDLHLGQINGWKGYWNTIAV